MRCGERAEVDSVRAQYAKNENMRGQNYGIIRIICVTAISSTILFLAFNRRAAVHRSVDKTRGRSIRNFLVTVETDPARGKLEPGNETRRFSHISSPKNRNFHASESRFLLQIYPRRKSREPQRRSRFS